MQQHKNEHFNIMQAPGNMNLLMVVIKGKRAPAGYPEPGAKIISAEMTCDEAIALADALEAEFIAAIKTSATAEQAA
jgi:hypothetical protein